MTFRKILVPFDFSAQSTSALETACSLVCQLQAELHLVHVTEGDPDSDSQGRAMEQLMVAVPPAVELQCKVYREVLSGGVHSELLAYTHRSQIDLIIMGTHSRSGLLRLGLGSVAERLLKSASCPVVIVRSDTQKSETVADQADAKYQSLKASELPALDLIARAISLRATDIHIDPSEVGQYDVRLRIDGRVSYYCSLDQNVAGRLMHQYLILAKLDQADPFRPREGRLQLPSSLRDVEVRITTSPVAGGEAVSLRLFAKENVFLPLDGLGFTSEGLETVQQMLRGDEGLVLVTGPTGSGKTTTVYSMLKTFGGQHRNIVSIEDPVEFAVPFVRQLNVDDRHGVTMTSGLRTLLRMDPDIIFVGEIRDSENAGIAFRAASYGRFVFSSLHTRDVASTITALRDMQVSNRALSSNLVGIVNQRLIRKLCMKCRKAGEVTASCKESFVESGLQIPSEIYEPVGCDVCRGTGFEGRCGVFESVVCNEAISQAIASNAAEAEIRRLIRSQGTDVLSAEAMKKVRDGLTNFDEANSVHWL